TEQDSEATNANGKTSFSNLTHGYYEITEKTPPAGYVKTEDATFYFKIDSGIVTWLRKGTNKPSEWESETVAGIVSFESAKAEDTEAGTPATNDTFTVQNEPGAALPSTGGLGTRMFTILGSVLLAFAGILLFRRRRII
ncbi:MAG: SpaA isopeptide-forming pilin-related protein, partial [Oscillospiraceae bacterium]|nr:SpaA isopeptide-forming pilin-related protein [Oscillospiraceae bacterium]